MTDPEFWHQRWAQGRIGFHRPDVNPYLRAYMGRLGLRSGDRVLVPLCGKSVDIPWLAGRGLEPVGVELSELAIETLFAEHRIQATRELRGSLARWHGGGITAYAGDFFDLEPDEAGPIAAAWDRAALIALPAGLRSSYARHCGRLLRQGARMLLVTMAYPDDGVEGPPYSVQSSEVEKLYGRWFDVSALERDIAADAPGPLKAQGVERVDESVWLLRRNRAFD